MALTPLAPPTRTPPAAPPLHQLGPDCPIGPRDWRHTAPAPVGLSGSLSSRSPAPVRWFTTRPATRDSRGTTRGSWPTAGGLWKSSTEQPSITRRSPTELCQRKSLTVHPELKPQIPFLFRSRGLAALSCLPKMSVPRNWNAIGWMHRCGRSSGSARRLRRSKRTTCSASISRAPSTASWSSSAYRGHQQPQTGQRLEGHPWGNPPPKEEGALDLCSVSRTPREFASGFQRLLLKKLTSEKNEEAL